MDDEQLRQRISRGDWAEPADAVSVSRITAMVERRRRRRLFVAAGGTGVASAAVAVVLLSVFPGPSGTRPLIDNPTSTTMPDETLTPDPCRNDQILLRLGRSGAFHGLAQNVDIANISGSACRFPKAPSLAVVTPRGQRIPVRGTADLDGFVLRPGRTASILVSTPSGCPGGVVPRRAHVIEVDTHDGWTYELERAAATYGCGRPPEVTSFSTHWTRPRRSR